MIRFTLNGTPVALDIPPERPLVRILRDDLQATGTKEGCSIGRCGACIVLVDGVAMNACLLMAWRVEGRAVTTIEGLRALPVGAALTEALTQENAFQCGYCAPGVVMALAGLLSHNRSPDDTALTEALTGNLCRCTGYHSILRGARRAVTLLDKG